jgi:hypothetical protein
LEDGFSSVVRGKPGGKRYNFIGGRHSIAYQLGKSQVPAAWAPPLMQSDEMNATQAS